MWSIFTKPKDAITSCAKFTPHYKISPKYIRLMWGPFLPMGSGRTVILVATSNKAIIVSMVPFLNVTKLTHWENYSPQFPLWRLFSPTYLSFKKYLLSYQKEREIWTGYIQQRWFHPIKYDIIKLGVPDNCSWHNWMNVLDHPDFL